MTKPAAQAAIQDIRFFSGGGLSYLEGCEGAVAVVRRLALLLNSERFGFGTSHHLYINFSPTMVSGQIIPTDASWAGWMKTISVGVDRDFKKLSQQKQEEIVIDSTVRCLEFLRPDCVSLIRESYEIVDLAGDDLRLLVKTRKSKFGRVNVAVVIKVWPEPSLLITSIDDGTENRVRDFTPLELNFFEDAFTLASRLEVSEDVVILHPRKSHTAQMTAKDYGAPLHMPIAGFNRSKVEPVFTKLVVKGRKA